MPCRARHRPAGQASFFCDKTVEGRAQACRFATEFPDSHGKACLLWKDPTVSLTSGPHIYKNRCSGGKVVITSDRHLTLQRRSPVLRSLRKEAARNQTIGPVCTNDDLCPIAPLAGGHLHALWVLLNLQHAVTGSDMGPGLNRFLHEIVVETVPHDHVGNRMG